MTKGIITILLLITAVITGVSQTNSVQSKINAIKSDNYMKNASITFMAVNMDTGEEIASLNPNTSLIPASIMKLFTTSTAFQTLGAGHRISTGIKYTGKIDSNGVLHGFLYVEGHGDPTLGSRFFTKEGKELEFLTTWADSVKAFGIKEIDGSVIVDGSYFSYDGVPGGWNWTDMGNYYGSGPAGLNIFDNMVYLHFATGAKRGDSTVLHCIEPHVPNLVFRNEVTTSDKNGDNSYIYGGPFSNDRFVVGTLPRNESDFKVKGSIPDPEDFFGYAFTNVLEERGVKVKYRHQTMRELQLTKEEKKALDLKPIKVFKGPKLYRIINLINQRSVNLFAESILNYMGARKYGTGNAWNGTSVVESYWKARNDMTGFYMNDGSGLSRTNAVSAKHFTDMLKYMYKQKTFESFKKSLAQTGKIGTIRSMCRGGSGSLRVYGKSGSMNRVRSYAGYVYSKSGKKIAFAVIFNNFNCTSTQVKRMCEGLFNVMAAY